MNNNDVIKKIRYAFDFDDDKMIALFAHAGKSVTRAEISNWLKREVDEAHVAIYDHELAAFLNGFIVEKRGRQEGIEIKNEKSLNNNQIFRKIKIALNLKDEDIISLFELAKFTVSKHELSAIFRSSDQKQYRPCKDQFLRNFLYGIELRYRN